MKDRHHLYRTTAPKVSFDTIKHRSAEIAMADGLSKYFGGSRLFSEVSFLIRGGERIGIIGPNGCGKTTLLNILLGKDEDFKGRGRLGEWVRYGYLGQEVEFEDEGRTILEELLAARDMPMDAARDYLAGFQFYGDEVDKRIEVLSGGERVRLYLGCMMLESPDCLIMDEPTNHLDVPARDALEAALLEFKGTVIAISHDRYFLNRCINRILEFAGGTLRSMDGNYDVYRQEKAAAQTAKQTEKQGKNPAETRTPDRPGRDATGRQRAKKPDVGQMEVRIAGLEGKRKELESTFGIDTPPEKYVEYDEILKELENLYEAYVAAGTAE